MSQHIKHSLSVSQRLWTLGGAAAVGIGALILVSAYENRTSSDALTHAERVREQVEQVVEMRHAHLTMVLAAIDTLVDAQEKAIHPDRIEAWTQAAKTMQEGAPAVKALAKELGLDAEAATYDADAAKLKQLITVDLKNLVEQGAGEAALHQIDDDIDAAGDNMTNMFGEFARRGGKAVRAQLDAANGTASQSLYVQLGTGLLAFLAVISMQLFHGSSLRRGINGVRHSMNRILNGDYQTSVHSLDRGDEIGEMARATEAFRTAAVEKQALENQTTDQRRANDAERQARDEQRRLDEAAIKQAVDALATGLERLAGGDITATIDTPFRADLERLRLDFNKTLSELQGVVGEIRSNSLSIQSYGQQMRNSSQDLAKRTEQQAASLEQTSAALGQITDRVRNSTQKARDVGTMVEETRLTSDRSGKVVAEAMSAMERIEEASREIGNIINVIDEIAFQTNLLALNAGVEAARAGEAGKGFAVVAQEVRELAGRAAGAAKDIKALIRKSGEEVRNGVELVTATGEVLRHIGSDVVKISEHVSSIVADAAEQNTGLAEINAAVNQMDQVTQQNAGMVEETSAASHTLAQDADQLINAISRFKVQERNLSYSAPQAVRDTARSQPSPARALVTKVAGAFNRNSSAQRAEPARVSEHWEEF